MTPSVTQVTAAVIFGLAIVHALLTGLFERLAHTRSRHARLLHLLGEVEVVFGFWALVLMIALFITEGAGPAKQYIDARNFTEPLFVFAVMVIAGTRPILQAALQSVLVIGRAIPLSGRAGFYLAVMALVPLLGSIITEPAAMTLAALILRDHFFSAEVSNRFKYVTLAVLFVNVSIGGTLTPYAAPPVLMVAGAWGWGFTDMLTLFGWKAAIAVAANSIGATLILRNELFTLPTITAPSGDPVPVPMVLTHVGFLVGVVVFSHHPAMFLGLFLFFLGVTQAYDEYQDRLILREGLLVAFFLAGLIVLGGQQQWWLQPLLIGMDSDTVFFGAIGLTAFTDNAALTYLGSLVEGLSDPFKYSLVAGAVTGGGLTIIANAPNPAGIAILRRHFDQESVRPLWLLLAALPPTVIAALAFWLL